MIKLERTCVFPIKSGYTPLHIAAHFGHVAIIRFLLSSGASVDSRTNVGYTPLHQAAQQGHTQVINLLLENKAQPDVVSHVSLIESSPVSLRPFLLWRASFLFINERQHCTLASVDALSNPPVVPAPMKISCARSRAPKS
jgi:ankyrin repeat protein